MRSILRIVLGITVLTLLVPVVAMAAPNLFEGTPFTLVGPRFDRGQSDSGNPLSVDATTEYGGSIATEPRAEDEHLAHLNPNSMSNPQMIQEGDSTSPSWELLESAEQPEAMVSGATETTATAIDGHRLEDRDDNVVVRNETTTTEAGGHSGRRGENAGGRSGKGHTPVKEHDSTDTTIAENQGSDSSDQPGSEGDDPPETTLPIPTTHPETISGSACPCLVTGVVELEGVVELQGDLVVDGGTLVARPDVDLDGNGHQIMFMNGGKADFQGTPVFTWSGRGSDANLERDIEFRNLRRIMFHNGAGPSILKYFRVSNSGDAGLGEYPLHWHRNGDTTRGTIVEGVVVENGQHHAFVPHGSHGITFKDTIAKNTEGTPYWWDLPGTNDCNTDLTRLCTADNSNAIVYEHALVDGVTNGPGDDRGFTLSGFLLGAGSGNVIRNSVAINVTPSNDKNCSGFAWPSQANRNAGGNVWLFENNHGESNCHGIFVWQNDDNPHVIDGFTGGGISHGAYINDYLYRNVDVPYTEIHAVGWEMRDSHAGNVTLHKHAAGPGEIIFTNVTFDSFTIKNADRDGDIPATYKINQSNLACSDIRHENVVPGTKVIIDGNQC